jgi:hypothetical protein
LEQRDNALTHLIASVVDRSWITPSIVIVGLGAVLFLIGVTGGGAEIKGTKVPQVLGPWRITALVSGIVFLLFGSLVLGRLGVSTPSSNPSETAQPQKQDSQQSQPKPNPAPNPSSKTSEGAQPQKQDSQQSQPESNSVSTPANGTPTENRVKITVINDLDSTLMWEVVDLRLGSLPTASFSSSRQKPHSSVSFIVPSTGTLNYTLKVAMRTLPTYYLDDPNVREKTLSSVGTISAEDEQTFQVWGDHAKSGYIVFLTPSRSHVP